MECIYCGHALDGSDEHILQQGFGSTLSSDAILCSACNALFSNTLDSHCVSRFEFIYNQLAITGKPKKGKGGHPGRSVVLEAPDSSKVIIDKEQRIAAQDKPAVTPQYDEQGSIAGFHLSGTDWSALTTVIKSIEKGLTKKGQTLTLASTKVTRERTRKLVSKTSFDNPYFKGVKKSILNFIAYHDRAVLNNREVADHLQDVYESARILEADPHTGIVGEKVQPLFSLGLSDILDFVRSHSDVHDICHVLLVSCNGDDGSVIGAALLFGQFVHGYLLSETYQGRSRTFFYSHSPLRGSEKTHIEDVPAALFGRASIRDMPLKEKKLREVVAKAFDSLSPCMWESSTRQIVTRKIENVFEPLPHPKGRLIDSREELVDAATRFFEDLLNIEHGEILANDPLLEEELRSILEKASRTLVNNLCARHGDMVMDDATMKTIGLNLFDAFSENIAPLLRRLFETIKAPNRQQQGRRKGR